jgi:hypothetical protein
VQRGTGKISFAEGGGEGGEDKVFGPIHRKDSSLFTSQSTGAPVHFGTLGRIRNQIGEDFQIRLQRQLQMQPSQELTELAVLLQVTK